MLGLKPRRADLDMNQHVNNVTYIGWVLEVRSPQNVYHFIDELTIKFEFGSLVMAEHTSRSHWYAWASSYNSRLQKRMPARWYCRFTHHLWNPWRPDLKAYRDQRICHVKHTRTHWEPILAYAEVVRKWSGDQSWENTMEKEILAMIFLCFSSASEVLASRL